MQLAYAISGYKQPEQFRWLLGAIWDPRDVYAVHIDARTPEPVFARFRAIAGDRSNIHFMPRQRVVWMGMGLVRAWLDSLRLLLDAAPAFSCLVNLSMQDYPLRPREAIVAELARAPGLNYVTCEPLASLPFHIRRRPWLMAFEGRDRLIRTPLPRPVPRDLAIAWKGSWWHVLDRAFCRWIVEDPLPRRYLAFLANVQAPDELVVQNLLMASPFRDARADRNRHFVRWSGTGGSPDTLTMVHHDELIGSSLWWARKVDETVDRDLLEALARRIGAPVPDALPVAA